MIQLCLINLRENLTLFFKQIFPFYKFHKIGISFYLLLCFSCEDTPSDENTVTPDVYPNSGQSISELGCSAAGIIRTADGNYVMVGTQNYTDPNAPLVPMIDAYAMKITDDGDSLWERNFGGFDADHGNSITETANGDLIIGMTTIYTQETSIHYDISAIRINNSGHIQWKRSFLGLWAEFYGSFVQSASDGGCVLGGASTAAGSGTYDITLLKLNSVGDSMWIKIISGTANEYVTSQIQVNDGGYAYAFLGYVQTVGVVGFLLKTDAGGDQQWIKAFGILSNYGKIAGEQTIDGGFILCATKEVNNSDDLYLVRTNSAGDTLWTHTYGGSGTDVAHQVRVTNDGGFIIAGVTTSYGHPSGYDACLVRTNSQGDTLWMKTYGGPLNDYVYSVVETDDHGFIAVGETENFGGGIFFVRTDSLGNELD